MRSRALLTAIFFGLGTLLAQGARAEVFLSKREALEQAFPGADEIDAETIVLSDAVAAEIEARAQARLESRLVTIHTGRKDGEVLGHAFIDVHQVRTLPEAFLVVLTPDGRVRQTKLLAFYEPPEYAPSPRWLALFDGRKLDPALSLGGEIHSIAGSTLSSRAITSSVRRSLATFEVVMREELAAAPAPDAASEALAPGSMLPPAGGE